MTKLDPAAIPASHPVQPVAPTSSHGRDLMAAGSLATCGACGLAWDDGQATAYTPAPSGRCPFEAFHAETPARVPTWSDGFTPLRDLPPLPADPEDMNDSRASWAMEAIHAFEAVTGTDRCDALKDLLCDLLHACDREASLQDFDDALDVARRMYGDETSGAEVEEVEEVEAADFICAGFPRLPAGAQPPAYNVVNGTSYNATTPLEVVRALEEARAAGSIVRLFFGDTATGAAWAEESDVVGKIGRSMGAGPTPARVPLLLPPRGDNGPHILDHCLVAIMTAPGEFSYRHPQFTPGDWRVSGSVQSGYAASVYHSGVIHARCKTVAEADRLCAFMLGERMTP
jgi:hypothetical protein